MSVGVLLFERPVAFVAILSLQYCNGIEIVFITFP